MNLEKFNTPNSIISDSFLRSCSISRIIKINEENRNRTKVVIMRKIRELNQQNRKKGVYSPLHSIESEAYSPRAKNLTKMKQKLSSIDDCKSGESRFKKNKKSLNQIKEETDATLNTSLISKLSTQNNKKKHFHRRFKSDVHQSTQYTEMDSIPIRSKIISQEHMKAELRMSEIKFQKISKKKKSTQHSIHKEEDEPNEYTNSLSNILNSFNRLRLMANAKGNQKIKNHFYKRSLENCSVEDLKYLLKVEANRKEEDQNQEGTAVPMRFGKTEVLRRGFFTSSEPQGNRESEEKKSVWNNEVIRQNCAFHENGEVLNLSQKKSPLNPMSCLNPNKIRKLSSKQLLSSEEKENYIEKPAITEFNQRDSQIETNLIYLYKEKRFPINDNKLNGIYENWQKEYIRKKRIQELMQNSQFQHMYQHRQIKIDSIKFRKNLPQQKKPLKELTHPSSPDSKKLPIQKLQFEGLTSKEVIDQLSQA